MKSWFGISLAALVAGCATSGEPEDLTQRLADRGWSQGDEVREIQSVRVGGWNSLDSQHLIIEAGPSRHYLLTFRNRCSELGTTERIGFSDTAGQLTPLDKVVVTTSAGMERDCLIDKIYKLEKIDN